MMKSAVKYLCVAMIVLAGSGMAAWGDWEFQESGVTVTLNDVCFIDEIHGWAVGDSATVIVTSDGGGSWERQFIPVSDSVNVNFVKFLNRTTGFCAGTAINRKAIITSGHVLKTTDGGSSWFDISRNIDLSLIQDMCVIDAEHCWISTSEYGYHGLVYYTENGGETWEEVFRNTNHAIRKMRFLDAKTGYALYERAISPETTNLLYTRDCFATCDTLYTFSNWVNRLWICSPKILWAGYKGLWVSSNGGSDWSFRGYNYFGKGLEHILPFDEQRAYCWFTLGGTDPTRVMLSYTFDGGITNHTLLELTTEDFRGWGMDGTRDVVWTVGSNGKIIRYFNNPVGIEPGRVLRPTAVIVSQNVPNPFNGSTSISFELSGTSKIELLVFDVTGRIVSTLASGMMPAGNHTVMWDGTAEKTGKGVSSGVYLCVLKAGNSINSKKMLMLR